MNSIIPIKSNELNLIQNTLMEKYKSNVLKYKEKLKDLLTEVHSIIRKDITIPEESEEVSHYSTFSADILWNNETNTIASTQNITNSYTSMCFLPYICTASVKIEKGKNTEKIYIGLSTEQINGKGNFLKNHSKKAKVWGVCGDGDIHENDQILNSNMAFFQGDCINIYFNHGIITFSINDKEIEDYSFDIGTNSVYLACCLEAIAAKVTIMND